jgi:hypothetical protein
MKMFGAVTSRMAVRRRRRFSSVGGLAKNGAAQGPKIKAGAACKNRQIVALFDLVNLCGGFSRPSPAV